MRRLALAFAVLAGLALAPAAAAAPVPGPNGPIIFTSGRDDGGTALMNETAQIWMLLGGGVQRITTSNTLHHRHPSWSPDRTKIAYARGPSGFGGPWDIFVHDLTQPLGLTNPLNVTASGGSEDRPTWSPDGTTLAYSKADAGGNWDVVTQLASGAGGETMIGDDAAAGAGASGQFPRPQWSPDGETIYFARIIGANNYDIWSSPSNGTNPVGSPIFTDNTSNDYQVSVSPDGSDLCFTRDSGADKNVVVYPLDGGTIDTDLAPGGIDYECFWSPDGGRIGFTRGAFGAGQLLARNSDGTDTTDTLTDSASDFDGNGEWTFDPSPTCQDTSVSVESNGFVSIPLDCTDEPNPPSFQDNSPFDPDILDPPDHGVLGGLTDNDTVIYTPDVNFEGTDSFTFGTSDGISDSEPATVSITVGDAGVGPQPGDPELSGLRFSRSRFRRGSERPAIAQSGVGTTISFTLSEAATARFSFQRAKKGRRVNGKCRKPTRRNKGKRKCTRYVRAGSFSLELTGGDKSVRFEGRLTSGKRLKVGRHRLTLTARDGDGNGSNRQRKKFKILRG